MDHSVGRPLKGNNELRRSEDASWITTIELLNFVRELAHFGWHTLLHHLDVE